VSITSLQRAKRYLDERQRHVITKQLLLVYHDGCFYRWCDGVYKQMSNEGLTADIWRTAEAWPDNHECLTTLRVQDLVNAVRSTIYGNVRTSPPCWIGTPPDGMEDIDPRDLIAVRNGLLHIPNGLLHIPTPRLFPHTPSFMTFTMLNFDYDPAAKAPIFEGLLRDWWPADIDQRETLLEYMGLTLTNDFSHEKGLMIVGVKRSGKGVIAKIINALNGGTVGVVWKSLSDLAKNFGLQNTIEKHVMIISEGLVSPKIDRTEILQSLLTMIGRDGGSVQRKYKDDYSGTSDLFIVITLNEIPKIGDTSGALAARFIVLSMPISFLDREDRTLKDKVIATEMSGILNMALDGLARLRNRGNFVQPATSIEASRDLHDSGSLIDFVRDELLFDPAVRVAVDDVYKRYASLADKNGQRPFSKVTFGKHLKNAIETLNLPYKEPTQLRNGADDGTSRDNRRRYYKGFALCGKTMEENIEEGIGDDIHWRDPAPRIH
jgi:putative DNA primase/helicase